MSAQEALTDAGDGARRALHVVKDMKGYARVEHEALEPLDLCEVIRSAVKMSWHEVKSRAAVVEDLQEVPLVMANDVRLGQVFLNLLVNAAQAVQGESPGDNEIRLITRVGDDGSAVAEVIDSGPGIEPTRQDHIFEAFFTTKASGTGTGLGLAISRRIVESFGGQISVHSEVGQGAMFRVRLPAAGDSLEESPLSKQIADGRIGLVGASPGLVEEVAAVVGGIEGLIPIAEPEHWRDRLAEGVFLDLWLVVVSTSLGSPVGLVDSLTETQESIGPCIVFLEPVDLDAGLRAELDQLPNARLRLPLEPDELRILVAEHGGRAT